MVSSFLSYFNRKSQSPRCLLVFYSNSQANKALDKGMEVFNFRKRKSVCETDIVSCTQILPCNRNVGNLPSLGRRRFRHETIVCFVYVTVVDFLPCFSMVCLMYQHTHREVLNFCAIVHLRRSSFFIIAPSKTETCKSALKKTSRAQMKLSRRIFFHFLHAVDS